VKTKPAGASSTSRFVQVWCRPRHARSITCNGFSSDIKAGKPASSPSRAWISIIFHCWCLLSYRISTQEGALLMATALTALSAAPSHSCPDGT
jgi:hypothetical protein